LGRTELQLTHGAVKPAEYCTLMFSNRSDSAQGTYCVGLVSPVIWLVAAIVQPCCSLLHHGVTPLKGDWLVSRVQARVTVLCMLQFEGQLLCVRCKHHSSRVCTAIHAWGVPSCSEVLDSTHVVLINLELGVRPSKCDHSLVITVVLTTGSAVQWPGFGTGAQH
jgi:hypothetical protein